MHDILQGGGKKKRSARATTRKRVCGSHSTARPYQDRKQRVQHVPKNHNGKPAFTSPADDTSCSYIWSRAVHKKQPGNTKFGSYRGVVVMTESVAKKWLTRLPSQPGSIFPCVSTEIRGLPLESQIGDGWWDNAPLSITLKIAPRCTQRS